MYCIEILLVQIIIGTVSKKYLHETNLRITRDKVQPLIPTTVLGNQVHKQAKHKITLRFPNKILQLIAISNIICIVSKPHCH